MEKADTYKLSVSKKFRVARSNPLSTNDYSLIVTMPKSSSRTISVVENYDKLGDFIQQLVDAIKSDTQNRDYLKMIRELNDDRVVPFLVECYKEDKVLSKKVVVKFLTKYPNNELALDVLKDAAIGPENSHCKVFEDSISISWYSEDIRQMALIGILKSDIDSALEFLLSKKNDAYPHERYMILLKAHDLPIKKRIKIYTAFLDDTNKVVAKKAREKLEELKIKE